MNVEKAKRVRATARTGSVRAKDHAWENTAPPAVPHTASLSKLREAAAGCRGCPLYKRAACVVFGEGKRGAPLMFVGEQPGDAEDLAGRPFVGPAGQMLDRALAEVHIDRAEVYVTNAVKHFKWEQRGKRRMHDKPSDAEVAACRPWLLAELRAVQPRLIVCLGATAARSVFEKKMKVLENRGQILTAGYHRSLITVHPSSLLRIPTSEGRREAYVGFVRDLKRAARAV